MNDKSATVLVTGATGYIGSWTVKYLLEAGYKVRGTVRDASNLAKNEFLFKLTPNAKERLTLVNGDLTKPEGWEEVVRGCSAVLHVASPYALTVKDAQKELVDPAVNGTLYVLKACKAAGGVKRVVLTSSVAAVSDCFDDWKTHVYGPNDWNTTSNLHRNPYYYSKVLAERAAHEFVEKEKPEFDLAVINPFVVIGPAVDPSVPLNTSSEITAQLIGGNMPMLPNLSQGVVDVRDVALMHIKAMEIPEAGGGKRFFGVAKCLPLHEFAVIVKDAIPPNLKRHVPTNKPIPFSDGITKVFAKLTQPKGASDYLAHNIGKHPTFDTSLVKDVLRFEFRDASETIRENALFIVENKKY